VAELSPYALRLALYLVLMLLFGRLLFVRPGLPRGISLALAVVALILVVTDAASRLSGVLGISPFDIDGETARWFLTGTPVGEAGLLRILALLAMLPLLAVKRPVQGLRRLALLAFSAATLASLAWNGHAAAGDGLAGRLRLATGIVHLLAAGDWVGAIAALLQLALRRQGLRLRERTYELWQDAHSFAVPGTIIVALLAMTGTYTYVDRNGVDGLHLAGSGEYQLVILDVMLPGLDGWNVLSRLREAGWQVPVLFLTARSSIADRVQGLELGADDYLAKPFAFAELLARVRTLLRRGQALPQAERIVIADLVVDTLRRRVERGGQRIPLSQKEYTLLELLARRRGEVLPRSLIASQVWDMNFDSDTNVIDVAIRRLRAKIDDDFDAKLIVTVRGMGYVLEAPDDGTVSNG